MSRWVKYILALGNKQQIKVNRGGGFEEGKGEEGVVWVEL